jgi:hypothetical protein
MVRAVRLPSGTAAALIEAAPLHQEFWQPGDGLGGLLPPTTALLQAKPPNASILRRS